MPSYYRVFPLLLAVGAVVACSDGPTTPKVIPASVAAGTSVTQLAIAGSDVSIVPAVTVKDASGNPAAGVRVDFAVASGSGTATGTSVVTDASGVAAIGSWRMGNTAGTNTLTATVASLGPVTFSATALEPGWVVKSIEAAQFYSCATIASGKGYCWGGGPHGSLGAGSASTSTNTPIAIAGNLNFQKTDATFSRNCGLSDTGLAYCWGPLLNGDAYTPSAVGGGNAFSQISTGAELTCGLTSAGKAYCWGKNDVGQLGDGTTTDRTDPVPVLGNLTFIALSVGYGHACGLVASGDAYCWGDNGSGQVGDGTTITRTSPVAVTGGLKYKSISLGFGYSCALTTGGAAYCWGRNDGPGNLGDGTTVGKLVPTAVSGGLVLSSISAGFGTTCGLVANGSAYCWGLNLYGKIGDGTETNRPSPVAVANGLRFQMIATSTSHTCGLTISGNAYCWGDNSSGALGNGVNNPRANPTPVPVRAP